MSFGSVFGFLGGLQSEDDVLNDGYQLGCRNGSWC